MPGRKGQRSGGHNAKTTEQHLADGTYQACRHGDRIDNEQAEGTPIKPDELDEIESQLWDEMVAYLPDAVIGRADTMALRELCRWYSLYRNAFAAWQCDPLDKDSRLAASASWDRFWRIARDFGVTPVERTRLQLKPGDGGGDNPSEKSPHLRLLEMRG